MPSHSDTLSSWPKRTRWLAAVGVLALGLILPIVHRRLTDDLKKHSPGVGESDRSALYVQEWSPIEAPLGRFVAVQDFDRVLSTREYRGSFDFGPVAAGMLELRLYLEPGSSCLPEWKVAWVPVAVIDPDQEAFCLSLDAFLNVHRMRGETEPWQDGLRVVWRFPEPARKVRIALPAFCRLRITAWQAVLPRDPAGWTAASWQKRPWRLSSLILAFTCFGLAAMFLWPEVVQAKLLDGFGLVLVGASFLITVFGLPPFQGPDEQDHWRDALLRYRRNAVQETLLYNLPEITGFDRVRWRVEAHVSPALFRATAADITPITERKFVNYAWYHSYPMVALVAWCFPRVETVMEALVFYYLCRLLPVLVIFALLYWLWRQERLPALALAILSVPYVQQQCTIVSTDTLANLAAVSAGLTFLAIRRQEAHAANARHRLATYTGLWLMSVLAFLAKPPIYLLVFLLPLWATPWQRLRRRAALFLGGFVFLTLIGLVLLVVWRAYRAMHEVPVADQFRQQLEFLIREGGWRYFLQQPLRAALDIPLHLQNWFVPLGWVDTYFHPYHLGLLRGLIVMAIGTDLIRALLLAERWLSLQALLRLVGVVVVGLLLFVGTWMLTALTMYLAVTPPRYPFIYGMQVRYLFPCLLAWIWLPLTLRYTTGRTHSAAEPAGHNAEHQSHAVPPGAPTFPPGKPATSTGSWDKHAANGSPEETAAPTTAQAWWRRSFLGNHSWDWLGDRLDRLVGVAWTATLLVFTVARLVGLVGDLLARYW